MTLLSKILTKLHFNGNEHEDSSNAFSETLSLNSGISGLKRSNSESSLATDLSSPDPCKEDLPAMKLTDTFREIKDIITHQEKQHQDLQLRKEKLLDKMKKMDEKVRSLTQRKDELEMELKRIERKQNNVQKELTNSQNRFSEMADRSRKFEKEIAAMWSREQYANKDSSSTIDSHQTAVISVCLTKQMDKKPNIYRLASGARDGMIRLWTLTQNNSSTSPWSNCEYILRGHKGWVKTLHFDNHSTGFLLSGGGGDHFVRVWNLTTYSCVSVLRGHTAGITSLTSNQINIYSSSLDKTIRIWDKVTGRNVGKYRGHNKYIKSVCLSSNNSMITAGGDDNIRIWDINSGKSVQSLLHIGGVNTLCQEDNYLYSGGRDGFINIFDVRMGEIIESIKAPSSITKLKIDNSILTYATSSPPVVYQYDIQSRTLIRELNAHTKELTDMDAIDDSVVSSSWDGTIKIYPSSIQITH